METVESEIISRFGLFLDRNEFTILRAAVDNEHFGNEVVICSSPRFRLKFVKDRGKIFAEISRGAREPWYPLEDVLKVALGSQEFEAYYMTDLTRALELNLEPVARSIHEKQDEIAAFGRTRAQEAAQDIFWTSDWIGLYRESLHQKRKNRTLVRQDISWPRVTRNALRCCASNSATSVPGRLWKTVRTLEAACSHHACTIVCQISEKGMKSRLRMRCSYPTRTANCSGPR